VEKQRFQIYLKQQLSFLFRSCRIFDSGYYDEAVRMAVIFRVLFHDTPKSTSLLNHLNATNINIRSTCSIKENETGPFDSFQGLGMHCFRDGRLHFLPIIEASPSDIFLVAQDWWNQPIYKEGRNQLLRRKDVVLAAANKDGGAHIDYKLPKAYEALSRPGALGHYYQQGTEAPELITGAHRIYLRQMAFEVISSHDLLSLIR